MEAVKVSPPALSVDPINPDAAASVVSSPSSGGAPPPGLTSLDDSETIDDLVLTTTHAQRRIHRAWASERARIVYAFASSEHEKLILRSYSIAQCCASPMIRLSGGGDVSVCPIRCRDRLCPLCALRRAAEAAQKYGKAVASMDAARHLVLTAPALDAPLAEQLRGMQNAMKRLRQQLAWKRRVVGGVYTIEVTFNKESGRWHPHLHVIVDGDFFPHHELMDAWRQALSSSDLWSDLEAGDRVIVHISAVHNRKQLARYIAKYIAKPAELCRWSLSCIREYSLAVVGKRMMHTFGTLHGVKLGVDDPNEVDPDSSMLIGVAELDWRGINGHRVAQEAVALVRHLLPHTSLWFGTKRDPGIDDWAAKCDDPVGKLKHRLCLVRMLTSRTPPFTHNKNGQLNNRNKTQIQMNLFENKSKINSILF